MLKSFWQTLNGKKRTIALLYWSVLVPSMLVIWPNGFPEGFALNFYKAVTIFGFLLSALGLGHAAIKKRVSNNQQIEEEVEEVNETEASQENSK
jgi:hypothetical protein